MVGVVLVVLVGACSEGSLPGIESRELEASLASSDGCWSAVGLASGCPAPVLESATIEPCQDERSSPEGGSSECLILRGSGFQKPVYETVGGRVVPRPFRIYFPDVESGDVAIRGYEAQPSGPGLVSIITWPRNEYLGDRVVVVNPDGQRSAFALVGGREAVGQACRPASAPCHDGVVEWSGDAALCIDQGTELPGCIAPPVVTHAAIEAYPDPSLCGHVNRALIIRGSGFESIVSSGEGPNGRPAGPYLGPALLPHHDPFDWQGSDQWRHAAPDLLCRQLRDSAWRNQTAYLLGRNGISDEFVIEY